MTPYTANLNLEHAPTIADFLNDRSDIRIIKGPVGSGKTTGMCFELMRLAMEQERSPKDGVRYSKAIVVRNTYAELKTTTIDSWTEHFPEEVFGKIGGTPPISQHIKIANELDFQIFFMALEKPKDVKKFLSLNASFIYFNEMREFEEFIIKRAWDRAGRFPSPGKDKHGVECSFACILGDTNPPDEDHWMYEWEQKAAKRKKIAPDNDSEESHGEFAVRFFNQPGAVIDIDDKTSEEIAEIFKEGPEETDGEKLVRRKNKEFVESKGLKRFFDPIYADNKTYMVNPLAENIPNLKANYYPSKIPMNNRNDINVYYQSNYGVIGDGKPVIAQYNDKVMAVENLAILEDRPLLFCADMGSGTLSPAGHYFQRHASGAYLIHAEIICEGVGVEEFANQCIQTKAEIFPTMEVSEGWGDPAGAQRDGVYETVFFDHLRAKGIPIKAAPSQAIMARIESLRQPMTRNIHGKPAFLINKNCTVTRAALGGKWHYKRVQVAGSERYTEKPCKDKYSNPGDSLGYGLMGAGEWAVIRGKEKMGNRKPIRAKTGWDVFK